MNLAYKKILGKFTKVLGFGKTPPPCGENFPNNVVFSFWKRTLRTIYLLISLVQTTCTWVLPQTEEGHARRCSWLKGSPKQCRSHNWLLSLYLSQRKQVPNNAGPHIWLRSLSLYQHKQVPSNAGPIIGNDYFPFINTNKSQAMQVP